MQIKSYAPFYLDAVIQLSLRAWSPVFDSIQNVMDTDVYQAFYPNNWRVSQQNAVRDEMFVLRKIQMYGLQLKLIRL